MIWRTLQPLLGVFSCVGVVIALLAFSPSTPTSPPTVSVPAPTLSELVPPPATPPPDAKALWGMPSEAQKAEGRRRTELMSACIKAKHPLQRCLGWQQVPASALTDAIAGTMPPVE